eukprot:TRINITY_DN1270_c0_g1_i2.p1 TRINITY_DN1270_c0_g1~~TRINITY_DN1270_c0_g1_i2.p1  ORF type:complete len:220 (+),score=47.24 TRINITY_DN1270_c0_g1_i2:145-804(+)
MGVEVEATSNSLKKILTFLIIVNVVGFGVTLNFLSAIAVIILVVGLIGVKKQHTGCLKFYTVLQSVLLAVKIAAIIFGAFWLGQALLGYYDNVEKGIKPTEDDIIPDLSQLSTQDTILYSAIAFAIFFMITLVLGLTIRSVVYTRKLVTLLATLPYSEETELEVIETDEGEGRNFQQEPVYVVPQPVFSAPEQVSSTWYPASGAVNLMPVYVEQIPRQH